MFNLKNYEYFDDLNLGLTKYTPVNKKILDVGCGHGMLGQAYRQKGNYVVGIDWAPELKGVTKKRIDKFYSADITDFKRVQKILKKERFDIIIFADVLEHIYDPVGALLFYKKYLAKNGKFLISVPNFPLLSTRFHILFGNYDYTAIGTREKTHIRIFTSNNIKKLAEHTQLHVEKLDITPGIARIFAMRNRELFKKTKGESFDRSAIMNSKIYKFYVKYCYALEYYVCKLWPGMFAYQYIVLLGKNENYNPK